jgi:hypothetical protein
VHGVPGGPPHAPPRPVRGAVRASGAAAAAASGGAARASAASRRLRLRFAARPGSGAAPPRQRLWPGSGRGHEVGEVRFTARHPLVPHPPQPAIPRQGEIPGARGPRHTGQSPFPTGGTFRPGICGRGIQEGLQVGPGPRRPVSSSRPVGGMPVWGRPRPPPPITDASARLRRPGIGRGEGNRRRRRGGSARARA